MSDAFENFAAGFLTGFSQTYADAMAENNRRRTAQLKQEMKTREAQLTRDNIAQTLFNLREQYYGDIPPIDPNTPPTVVEGSEELTRDMGRIYTETGRLVQAGMKQDDSIQVVKAMFGEYMDQRNRQQEAAMLQSQVHAATGDIEAAGRVLTHGLNRRLDGFVYDYRPPAEEGEYGTIDVYDGRTRELISSMPHTEDLADHLARTPAAAAEYMDNMALDDIKSRRAAQRLGLEQVRNQREERRFRNQLREDTRDRLTQGLIDVVSPGADPKEFAYDLNEDQRERYGLALGMVDMMADSAAVYESTDSEVSAQSEALNDLFDGSIMNTKRDQLRISTGDPGSGGYWIEYKGRRFPASPQLRARFEAIRSQMPQ